MQKVVIAFFSVFLTSRFFTETVRVAPKPIDVIDLAFIPAIVVLAIVFNRPNRGGPELSSLNNMLMGVVLAIGVSTLVNADNLLIPAAILFTVGFLQGPMLFWSLNKVLGMQRGFHSKVWKMMVILFFANVAVVVFLNVPKFISTKNPDDISGTFGLNAYFFSAFLLIAAGFFIGMARIGRINQRTHLIIQIIIVSIFYLLQYRAALPFFLAAYLLVLVRTYNRQILKPVLVMFFIGYLLTQALTLFTQRVEADLKYDSWIELASNPGDYLSYGKFLAYRQTAIMMIDQPVAILAGVGPGNYLSRAYHTFSTELLRGREKGVGRIIEQYMGITQPRFTYVSDYYMGPTYTEAVFGSKQLSNPNSSIIAPIAEIGLIGGGLIVLMYLFLCWKAWQLVAVVKRDAPDILPIACAFLTGAIYVTGLGFLDNVWEMSRATLPVWLLFYVTVNGLREFQERAGHEAAQAAKQNQDTEAKQAASEPSKAAFVYQPVQGELSV